MAGIGGLIGREIERGLTLNNSFKRRSSVRYEVQRSRCCARDCTISAAISSDTGERRVVGRGFYRVDKYGEGEADVSRALSAAHPRRSWILRPSRAGNSGVDARHSSCVTLRLRFNLPQPGVSIIRPAPHVLGLSVAVLVFSGPPHVKKPTVPRLLHRQSVPRRRR